GVALLELLELLVERDDLGRAHEREVERVEEEDDVLPVLAAQLAARLEVRELHVDELEATNSLCLEVGRRLLHANGHRITSVGTHVDVGNERRNGARFLVPT